MKIGRWVILTDTDLYERLGHTYRDGYKDGEDDAPFRRGWWLGAESRAAMSGQACVNRPDCGPICHCDG